MVNGGIDTEVMSLRIRRYVSAIGSFRDRSRSRNRRRSYTVNANGRTSTGSVRSNTEEETYYQRKSQVIEGIEGFDELRQIVKTGCDGSRELATIIADRAALELHYAKQLQKLGARLAKICASRVTTTTAAWETVAEEMNVEAESHQKIGESLMDDICKPLRNMCDNHIKVKKPIELAVEKATRTVTDRKIEENKYKQKSFHSTAEAEKLHADIIDKRKLNKKNSDKEVVKMEKKLTILKESIRKSGRKYYSSTLLTERSRQEWECTSIKSMVQLQQLEEERLKELHKYLTLYKNALEAVPPQMTTTCQRIGEASQCIDFEKDLRKIVESRQRAVAQPEQTLFETYAEDLKQDMDRERRRQALTLFMYYLAQDIETEKKTVAGVQKLVDIYKSQPDYADYEAIEETKLQARQVHAMLNFLDASHFKLSKALNNLNGQGEESNYKFAQYLEDSQDKSGLPCTYLRVPNHLICEGFNDADFTARGRADGSHDSATDGTPYEAISHDDDYSDVDNDEEFEDNYEYPSNISIDQQGSSAAIICKCRVLYDFNSSMSTELTVKEGDEVNITEQHEDGWWKAEIRGNTGVIPASYVEEIR